MEYKSIIEISQQILNFNFLHTYMNDSCMKLHI